MDIDENPIQMIVRYLNELELLRKKALDSRHKLVLEYNYNIIHDYRITIFEQIDRLLIYHDTNVVLFLRYISNPKYVSDLFSTSEMDSKRIAIDYLQRTKHSLIIFVQSVIESYYRSICSTLALKVSFNFSKVLDSLFKEFGIQSDSEWYKANNILAKIRNTLHNNGKHTNPDETIIYHSKQYIFTQNSLHYVAGYDTIIFIISDLIDFLCYIGAKSSKVNLIDNNNGGINY